jgi:hypothetical protein
VACLCPVARDAGGAPAAQVILLSSLGGTGLLTLCALLLYLSRREQLEDDTDEGSYSESEASGVYKPAPHLSPAPHFSPPLSPYPSQQMPMPGGLPVSLMQPYGATMPSPQPFNSYNGY